MADLILKPEVIAELPFPGEVTETEAEAGRADTKETYSPESTPAPSFPVAIIARDVISSSFNTQQKRILGEFTFNESGAIAIGKYEAGVTGDVRISPSGIIGRNKDGDITFSLDATTGDATFLGTLAAGSLIAGDYFTVAESGAFRGIFINDGTYDVIFMGIQTT